MGHIHETQTSIFSLMRNEKDASAIGTLLDDQPFTPVTVAIEVVVADQEHVFLFSQLLSIGGWDEHYDSKDYKDEPRKKITHEGRSANESFRLPVILYANF